MNKYRKKPVVVEAKKILSTADLPHNESIEKIYSPGCKIVGYIHTLEGKMEIRKGEWLIKGIQGEYYPCKPDIFAETYELAED